MTGYAGDNVSFFYLSLSVSLTYKSVLLFIYTYVMNLFDFEKISERFTLKIARDDWDVVC